MLRTLVRRFTVGVLGVLALAFAVVGTGAEVSAQYPYNGYNPYGGQQYANPYVGQQYANPYAGQQYAPQQYAQPYTNYAPYAGQQFANPYVAPRYYYQDNRYCGDGRLFIENGINFCANSGVRVIPIYPDYVGGYGGGGYAPYGYASYGYR